MVILHADAVAENRSARVGARGIDRDDAQRLAFAPVELRELVNQRALPRPGCAGHAEDARLTAVREECLQQIRRLGPAILDRADGPCQGTRVARAQALYPGLEIVFQTFQCKAERKGWETRRGGQWLLRSRCV